MSNHTIARVGISVLLLASWGSMGCGGRSLNRKSAQRLMARPPLELSKEGDASIESITEVAGGAILEARLKVAFRVEKNKEGDWVIREVRVGDRPWENFEDILRALDQEKEDRTRGMLENIAGAIQRYWDAKGALPEFKDYADLADQLHPVYLSPLLRLDAWQRPLTAYRVDLFSIRLASAGEDGNWGSPDDIELERRYPR